MYLNNYPPSPPLSTSTPVTKSNNSFYLEKVVQLYGNQPELLELILSSKLEEDRRRTEEAKLRRKEIDFMLLQQQKKPIISQRKKSNSIEMLLNNEPILNHKKRAFTPSDSEDEEQHKKRLKPVRIVETTEFPYNDDYLWKNNGNTIHRKSGLKSIYYKCSQGCPVNKIVTFKENGQYLIKYRGQHLSNCNRIKRIVNL